MLVRQVRQAHQVQLGILTRLHHHGHHHRQLAVLRAITTSSSDSNGIHWNGGRNTTITITASGTTPNVTIVSNSNKLFPKCDSRSFKRFKC